jgi:hypothetical protein
VSLDAIAVELDLPFGTFSIDVASAGLMNPGNGALTVRRRFFALKRHHTPHHRTGIQSTPIGIRSRAGTEHVGCALACRGFDMPHYYFDVKNGHRLIDPTGLECRDDQEAITQAWFIAAQIAMDVPNTSGGRSVAVLNSAREEIRKVPIKSDGKGDHHGGERAGPRQRPQGRGEEANAAQVEADGEVRLDQTG